MALACPKVPHAVIRVGVADAARWQRQEGETTLQLPVVPRAVPKAGAGPDCGEFGPRAEAASAQGTAGKE